MNTALLGVDIGTTSLKACAFSTDGRQVAKALRATPTSFPKPDWAEHDHDALWSALVSAIREAVSRLPKRTELSAIAFTGMAEAALPLDHQDRPLYAAISWSDRRVLPEMRDWQARIGQARTARITGLGITPAAGILRLLWLRRCAPEVFRRTAFWLNLPDYAAFRLCGAKATEYSLASRMMHFDLAAKAWSSELLDLAGLDCRLFAQPVASGVRIGEVSHDAAHATGLPARLPVCTGGHDHVSAAFGLGATREADFLDSIGTAEAIVAKLDERRDDPAIAESGVHQGIHMLPNCHYAMSGLAYGGGSLDWARRLLLSRTGTKDDIGTFKELNELAARAPVGSGGALFLPHLRQSNPPIIDPASRGAFVGLSSETGPQHLALAVMEGIAFEFKRIQDHVCDCFGLALEGIIATGGGARNDKFMQIKADVSGIPISIPDVDEAACLGAALAAGIGAGVYRDHQDALSQVKHPQRLIEPAARAHEIYRERYETVYLTLYDSLKDANHAISDFVGQ